MSAPEEDRGATDAGRLLWRSVVADFELEEHELLLLEQAVRTVDGLEALHEVITAEGVMVGSGEGARPHAALVEARQQRILLARILAALRVPTGDEEDSSRQQRRVGVRGVYAPKRSDQ